MEIKALVANVLDKTRITLNVGREQGVETGNKVTLWNQVEVKDPKTGNSLGKVWLDKLNLYVTFVDDLFCIAEVRSANKMGTFNFFTPEKTIRNWSGQDNEGTVEVNDGDEATIYTSGEDVEETQADMP